MTGNTAPLYIVAFAGETEVLAATFDTLDPGYHPIEVLGSDDDEALQAWCAARGISLLERLPGQVVEGRYWCTLLTALPAIDGPCLVLRAGSRVPTYWASRLRCAVSDRAAALFPLSLRHPCTRVFDTDDHQPGLGVQAVDNWLARYAPGRDYDVPVFCGQTAWLDRRRFPREMPADDAALARDLLHSGALLLATDRVYVDDRHLPPQSLPTALYPGWRDAVEQRHHLTGLRHAMTQLSQRQEAPPADLGARPVRLHISHNWGGGLGRWVTDFVEADAGCRSLVLKPIGDLRGFAQSLALYEGNQPAPLAMWTLARPILSTVPAHAEYVRILQQILREHGVTQLMVSSVIGHSLEVLETGLPTTLVCHDFYPVCPPILATWEDPCRECDDERLMACLKHNPLHRLFEFEPPEHWLALRHRFLDIMAAVKPDLVVPTTSVADRWQLLAPSLRQHRFHVIPHGLPRALIDTLALARQGADVEQSDGSHNRAGLQSRRLRIVVLGSLENHKGGALLQQALPELCQYADLILLGCGDDGKRFTGHPGVRVIPRYDRNELGRLLAEQDPDLGLLLSTVPETFSYTLSELQAADIPVAATALGAFADRVSPDENGWLFQPVPEALVAAVKKLAEEPSRIEHARNRLMSQAPRDTQAMVRDYDKVVGCGADRITGRSLQQQEVLEGPIHALSVLQGMGYRSALRAFLGFTAQRAQQSPRVPGWLRRPITTVLGWMSR